MDVRARALETLRTRGTVPVFPLPDLVFFPHASLPLHIFEPRYRQMTEDVLGGDRLIAMALLKPGWERGFDGSPEIFPMACAGIIEEEARLPGRVSQPLAFDSDIPFAAVVNTLCQSLAMELPLKMALLGLDDVRERCRLLIRVLEERWRDIALSQAARRDPDGEDVH